MTKLFFVFSCLLASLALSHPLRLGQENLKLAQHNSKTGEVIYKIKVTETIWSKEHDKQTIINKALAKISKRAYNGIFNSCTNSIEEIKPNEFRVGLTCTFSKLAKAVF